MVGITSFGGYVPRLRLQRQAIVDALSELQSESHMLACAISIELNRDYLWFRGA